MTEDSLNDNVLVGRWEQVDGRLVADAVARKIDHLIADVFERVAAASDGWSVLSRNPSDASYWELTYPQSELAGGGPPLLRRVS